MQAQVIPILPSKDFDATAAFYSRLGYSEINRYVDYLLLSDGTSELHFTRFIVEPDANYVGVYFRVEDAAALAQSLGEIADVKPWGQVEFNLSDPDGTQLRFGTETSKRVTHD